MSKEESVSDDPNELLDDIAEGFGDIANLISQFVYSLTYDKVEKYSQIDRDFARILCNLTIISGFLPYFSKNMKSEKLLEIESKKNAEIEEFNENIERFIKSFEEKGIIDPDVWNGNAKHYVESQKPIIDDFRSNEVNERLEMESEKFKVLNNRVFEIVEKYKTDAINNIEKLD